MPKVSVILTSFNHAKYIREAIDSALNQTFTDFELIILDDSSSDNSWDLINQYSDPRIRAFRSGGPGEAVDRINEIISAFVAGEYIAIHHSDDVWTLDKLGKQVAFLETHHKIGAVFTNALAIREDSFPLSDEKHFYSNIFDQPNRSRHEWLRFFFNRGNALCHPSVLIRKVCYVDCGLYRFGMAQLADLDMWIRLCLKYEIHVLPERLVRFRVRESEANASGNRPETRIRGMYEYYKLLPNYRKLKSFDDLVKVFPSAEKYDRKEETDMDFALAMIALEEKPFTFTQLFGLDLLFDAISDPGHAANIKRLYDFDYRSFIALTGQFDVFSREAAEEIAERDRVIAERDRVIAERDRVIAERDRVIAERGIIINSIYASRSWRVTGPIRSLSRLMTRSKSICVVVLRTILQGAVSRKETLSNSSDNLLALHALSERRFDKQALENAVGVPQPASWPEIDLSVVTYNSSRWIGPFIDSLVSQRYPLSRINLRFVDHGSRDDTVLQLEKFLSETESPFGSARIIQQSNLGFGAGHDRAIKEGKSEYCLVTNVDLEFEPSSLCNVVRVALSDKDGAVASWELRQVPFEHPKYYDPVTLETNWSSHACILLRRSVYIKVGGYDPHIFMYAEDVELSYRFRSYGYILKYVPNAVVNHFTYESAGQVKPLQFSGNVVGNIYIRLRYGKTSDWLAGLLLYGALVFSRSPFDGAKSLLLKNAFKLIAWGPHFLRGKGPAPAYFPLRGFDYEMVRDGAFWEMQPCPAADAAPLVTVITRTYKGRGMFLEQAMQSVFNQTYPAIELLVVEDGGDSQQALVTSVAERAPTGCRVRFLANEKLGRAAAGNAGLAVAKGYFLMFLDDDDLLFSDHVETLVSALSRDTKLSAAYALAIEVHTKVDPARPTYIEDCFHTDDSFRQEWDYNILLLHNFIPIQAILFKRELYERRGGFDTELDQLEDWNLWLRYGFGNQFAYIPKTTSLFRTPSDPKMRLERLALLKAAHGDAKDGALKRLGQLCLR